MTRCDSLSFLHSPNFLQLSLHAVSLFAIPTHLYGGYCILVKTPHQMRSVKRAMFNLHFWSALMDLFLSLLTAPFILLPSLSGVPLGLLTYLKVSTPVQIYMVFTVIAMTGISILHIFENRYNKIIFDSSLNRKTIRSCFYTFNYLLIFTFIIPTMLRIPDQKLAVEIVFNQYPCEFDPDRFFVLAIDVQVTHYCVTATAVLIELQVAFFVIRLLLHLRAKNMKSSQRTQNLQKRLFMAICIQVTIPICLVFVPFFYVLTAVSIDYHNQGLNNLSMLTASLHGFISTIVMLFVHKPYRDATFKMFTFSSPLSSAPIQIISS